MCVEYVRILHAWSPAWYGTESVNEYKRMQTNANEFKPSLDARAFVKSCIPSDVHSKGILT